MDEQVIIDSSILKFPTLKDAEKVEAKLLKVAQKRGNKCTKYSEIIEYNGEFGVTVLNSDLEELTADEKANKEDKPKAFDTKFNKRPVEE